jgi:hypothetical protein
MQQRSIHIFENRMGGKVLCEELSAQETESMQKNRGAFGKVLEFEAGARNAILSMEGDREKESELEDRVVRLCEEPVMGAINSIGKWVTIGISAFCAQGLFRGAISGPGEFELKHLIPGILSLGLGALLAFTFGSGAKEHYVKAVKESMPIREELDGLRTGMLKEAETRVGRLLEEYLQKRGASGETD